MPFDHLWATWRSGYVRKVGGSDAAATGAADAPAGPPQPGSLFEQILAEATAGGEPGDAEAGILMRGPSCFAILNRFPYTAGHLMVLPNRAVADLEDLTPGEQTELWSTVRDAVVALRAGLGCEGVNVGVNLGPAAGGSQSDHLHVHCVPRWIGDANFLSVTADTRVLPMSLVEARDRLRAAWPPRGARR